MITLNGRAAILLLTTLSVSWSQSILGSRYPLGVPIPAQSGTALSMGGAAVAVTLDQNLMFANPANLGDIDKTAFSSLLSIDGLRISVGAEHTNHASVTPHQIGFAFPFRPLGTVGMAVSKISNPVVKFVSPSTGGTVPATVSLDRTGGMTAWEVAWGRAIGKWLFVGIAFQRLYYLLNNTLITQDFRDPEGTSRDSSHLSFSGNALRMGVIVPFGDFLAGLTARVVLDGGLAAAGGVYRWGERSSIPGSSSRASASLQLPAEAALGFAWRASPQWLLATDLAIVRWKQFDAGDLLPAADRSTSASYSLGAEFVPALNLLAPRYWETIRYRCGARITALPLEDNREMALSLGTGLPLKGGGLLDLTAEVGRRSDSNLSNISETFVQVGLGFNGGRTWSRSGDIDY